MAGAGAPEVAPADERPLVAGVGVLDLEVAGGVADERLPRAARRVIAPWRVPPGAGWMLSMAQPGAMMSSRRVASRSWNARLKRPMTPPAVVVMSPVGLMRFLVDGGRGLTLSRARGHAVPEGGPRSAVARLDQTTAPISPVVGLPAIVRSSARRGIPEQDASPAAEPVQATARRRAASWTGTPAPPTALRPNARPSAIRSANSCKQEMHQARLPQPHPVDPLRSPISRVGARSPAELRRVCGRSQALVQGGARTAVRSLYGRGRP
jgi:hypothetical protein